MCFKEKSIKLFFFDFEKLILFFLLKRCVGHISSNIKDKINDLKKK